MGRLKNWKRSIVAACAVVVMPRLPIGTSAQAADIGIGSGTHVNVPVQSMKELGDKDLVKQRLDYSCGAAGLMPCRSKWL
jgi:hypothetical protein